MSLDVSLIDKDGNEVFSANVTHNLNKMAAEAGIYKHIWRPEEIEVTQAIQLIHPLAEGLRKMTADPDHFKTFNPENGWGSYDRFVPWIAAYLAACAANPFATIGISR